MGEGKENDSLHSPTNDDAIIERTSTGDTRKASQRWAILRSAILRKSSISSKAQPGNNNEGSIHQFAGFGFLHRERLPRSKVSHLQQRLTNIRLSPGQDLATALELSLLALTALKPAQWIWEFTVDFSSHQDEYQTRPKIQQVLSQLNERLQGSSTESKQKLRLGLGSGWITKQGNDKTNSSSQPMLKIVLAPFVPSQGMFQYILPSFDSEGKRVNHDGETDTPEKSILYTRERLSTAPKSLRELTSHHHHQGVDNTGNICVWDSEQTMTFGLLKYLSMSLLPWWPQSKHEEGSSLDILELGAGMAGLAGLALAQKLQEKNIPFRLFLTDGHPQAVKNNQVHAHVMNQSASQPDTTYLQQSIECLVLPWSMDPPTMKGPPPCHVALVSDCTHFQEYHAHLFLTLARVLRVNGYVYLCQPHRGRSLERFLDVVRATSGKEPLFSMEWINIPELLEADAKAKATKHYDRNIHFPYWICLHKLRPLDEQDRSLVLEHMANRDG